MKQTFQTRDLCAVAVFTALTAAMAWLSIPLPYGVPLTFQTLAVLLAGVVLGPKKGALAAAAYLLLGTAGAPVFAGGRGGLGVVFGPTGGFLLSFPLMALAAGIGASKTGRWPLWLGVAAGAAVNYMCGMLYFSLYMSSGLLHAFTVCVLPFIPADILKMAAAGLLGKRLRTLPADA
ncbi:MAG: biotin transporter BioY [Oscillospiraceae bacterium]|nr:biotin transporter BioY [Oscillospiraceae bacterium]